MDHGVCAAGVFAGLIAGVSGIYGWALLFGYLDGDEES